MADSVEHSERRQQSDSDPEHLKLSDLLDRGWKIFEEVDSTNEPLSSNPVQVSVRRGINMLEEASRMVAQLDLFSRNEELEEISTADLKYLLLPALLGGLHMKQSGQAKRLEIVQAARTYFLDFLKRCNDYGISHVELPKSSHDSAEEESGSQSFPTSQPDLVAMASKRQSKIECYRQRKELEAKLSEARRIVESGQADDEVCRDFYILHVRRWTAICLEEIEAIDQEMEILKNMDFLKQGPPKQPAQPARQPMKPFVLTKDAVQAQVFGAGYPSLPTMTVDDWYEQHRKHGVLPDQGVPSKASAEGGSAENESEEEKEEDETEESVQKARNWDDWKDTHRRGYGNRQNMG